MGVRGWTGDAQVVGQVSFGIEEESYQEVRSLGGLAG